MRKVALALVLLLCAYSGAAALSKPGIPLESVVQVISRYPGGTGICTGWVSDDVKNRIITAAHCTRGSTAIMIRLLDGSYVTGHLVGESAEIDVAVIRVHELVKLKAAPHGNSDELIIGDKVTAVGHPRGGASWTVTYGEIFETYGAFLLNTARINFGNSGGPLFDEQGRVIGSNVMMQTWAQNWLFTITIPINDVLAAVRLIESKNPQ